MIPGIGPMISTSMVAAVGKGETFDRGRDFAGRVGRMPRQDSIILGRITKRVKPLSEDDVRAGGKK